VTISIVVPAFNEARGLPATLASIQRATAAFDARGWRHELIVCDNNSTDATGEIARAAGATVVFEPVNQISRARNAGASRATGDWLVFVDADSHPSLELFSDTADAIAGGRCLAGGSTVAIDSSDRLGRGVVAVWNAISRALRLAAGSFIFCDAQAFRDVRGFSLEFYAAEELDLFTPPQASGAHTRADDRDSARASPGHERSQGAALYQARDRRGLPQERAHAGARGTEPRRLLHVVRRPPRTVALRLGRKAQLTGGGGLAHLWA